MKELLKCTCTVRWNIRQCIQKMYSCKQFLLLLNKRCSPQGSVFLMKTEAADYLQSDLDDEWFVEVWTFGPLDSNNKLESHMSNELLFFEYVYIFIFIFIYICIADAVKSFHLELSDSFFNLLSTFKHFLPSYSQGSGIFFQDTSKIRHFLPSYFQDQAFSSKLLPRSGIFFQVTSKIRYFLARSCKTRHFLARSCKTRHYLPRSSKIPARIMHCLPRSWKWNLTDSCKKCMGVRLGYSFVIYDNVSTEIIFGNNELQKVFKTWSSSYSVF